MRKVVRKVSEKSEWRWHRQILFVIYLAKNIILFFLGFVKKLNISFVEDNFVIAHGVNVL